MGTLDGEINRIMTRTTYQARIPAGHLIIKDANCVNTHYSLFNSLMLGTTPVCVWWSEQADKMFITSSSKWVMNRWLEFVITITRLWRVLAKDDCSDYSHTVICSWSTVYWHYRGKKYFHYMYNMHSRFKYSTIQ